ncbi:hypothetical protein MNBD_NITROSPINAE02-2142 [hydrothermal vent metagenome]|uniref:Uncharacterized protein n=1 Tax=hydrothermal vent metagenome TaxID=652676 RepID=A0A3B1BW88_9ZZZZ
MVSETALLTGSQAGRAIVAAAQMNDIKAA